ncbi:MFS transporter [Streptomyces sp. NPDC001904]|uniref:MFS transporter n=1 Tax=Streptomyces sp. NPDC001904 TaxID=3154531 RepID=UPI00332874CA
MRDGSSGSTVRTTPGGGRSAEAATEARGKQTPRVVVGWLTQFAVGTDLFVLSPLLPDMARGLGVSVGAMGAALTCFSVAYIVCAPLLGRAGDRFGRRTVLAWSLVVFTLANLATALAPNYPVLIAVRVLAGVAAAGTGPTVYALTGAAAPAERRGTHLAVVGSGLLSALWAGAPLGSLVGHSWGWRVVFHALAVGTVFLAVANVRLWRGAPGSAPGLGAAAERRSQANGLSPGLLVVGVTALWALGVYLLYTFLGTAMQQSGRSDWTVWSLVAYGVGAVPGSLLGGRLADRVGAVRVATVALVAAAMFEAAFAAVFDAHATGLLLPVLLLFAVCAYAAFPAQQRRLLDRFPDSAAALMGWNNSALFLGISVAGVLGPLLIDAWSYRGNVLVGASVALVAALASVAVQRLLGARPQSGI